jgi:hypothetical protein
LRRHESKWNSSALFSGSKQPVGVRPYPVTQCIKRIVFDSPALEPDLWRGGINSYRNHEVHCPHLQAGVFTRWLDKEKGGSIYPENGCLGLFKVALARAEWVTGTLDKGDNVICSLSMILVKTVYKVEVDGCQIWQKINLKVAHSGFHLYNAKLCQ